MPPKQRASHSNRRNLSHGGGSQPKRSTRGLHSTNPSSSRRHGAPDHPHFFTQGRTGGGQGMGLRHDSSRSRTPDHITSAHVHPGSSSIAEDVRYLHHQSMHSAFDGPADQMHRATIQHNFAQKPSLDDMESSAFGPKPNTWSINDVPSQDPIEAYTNRIRKEVEFDYYARDPKPNQIQFPQPNMSQQRQSPLDDFGYHNPTSNNNDHKFTSRYKPDFIFGATHNAEDGAAQNDSTFKRPPNTNNDKDFASYRATDQTYRHEDDDLAGINWNAIDNKRPNWNKFPGGDPKVEKAQWHQRSRQYAEGLENLMERVGKGDFDRKLNHQPPKSVQKRLQREPKEHEVLRKKYPMIDRYEFMPMFLRYNHRQFFYVPRLNANRHHEPERITQLQRDTRGENFVDEEAAEIVRQNRRFSAHQMDKGWVKQESKRLELQSKIDHLRKNMSNLSDMQNQVNNLRTQFYSNPQSLAGTGTYSTKSKAKTEYKQPQDDSHLPTSVQLHNAVTRQQKYDAIEQQAAKNVNRVAGDINDQIIEDSNNNNNMISSTTPTKNKKKKLILGPNGEQIEVSDNEDENGEEEEQQGEQRQSQDQGNNDNTNVNNKAASSTSNNNEQISTSQKIAQQQDQSSQRNARITSKIATKSKKVKKTTRRVTNTSLANYSTNRQPILQPNKLALPRSAANHILAQVQQQYYPTSLVNSVKTHHDILTELFQQEQLHPEERESMVQELEDHLRLSMNQLQIHLSDLEQQFNISILHDKEKMLDDEARQEYIAQKQQQQQQQQEQNDDDELQVGIHRLHIDHDDDNNQVNDNDIEVEPLVFQPRPVLQPISQQLQQSTTIDIDRPINPIEMPTSQVKREFLQQKQKQQNQHQFQLNQQQSSPSIQAIQDLRFIPSSPILLSTPVRSTTVSPIESTTSFIKTSTPTISPNTSTPQKVLTTPVMGAALRQLNEFVNADREDDFSVAQMSTPPTFNLDSDEYIQQDVLRSARKSSSRAQQQQHQQSITLNPPQISLGQNPLLDSTINIRSRSTVLPQIVKPSSTTFAPPPNVLPTLTNTSLTNAQDGITFSEIEQQQEEQQKSSPYHGSSSAYQQSQYQHPVVEIRTDVHMTLSDIDQIHQNNLNLHADPSQYNLPGSNMVNQIRFTHNPNNVNQVSAINDMLENGRDTML